METKINIGELIEKFVFYVLGGVSGLAFGFILISLEIAYIANEPTTSVIGVSTFVGIILSIIINEHRSERNLRENTRVRNETVALITHEMRTCLTSAGWSIQMLLQNYEKSIKEDDKKMLKDAIDSIHTTVMHSVNLLDVSLLDIGKLSISLEWVSLEKVEETFKEVIEKYTFGANEKGVHLIADIHLDHAGQVQVDMLRLRIILENLLENSLQYTTQDIKEIKVTINNDKNVMKIVVSDTGIGIPAGEVDKITSEFYRASNARKQLSSGSGIGLYMCNEYIKSHHGTFRFESKENEGTSFFITIPLRTTANVNQFLDKI